MVKGGMCGKGGMHAEGGMCGEGGACMARRGASMAGEPATAADGMHSTAMHSCYHLQTKLREGYVFTAVCDSVHRGGSVSVHAGIPSPPPDQAPPPKSRYTPLEQALPQIPPNPEQAPPPMGAAPAQCMLGDTANKRAVCILLECNLVF